MIDRLAIILLLLLSLEIHAQPGANPYAGYRPPWQPPPGQWQFAPPDQRQNANPGSRPAAPGAQSRYPNGWSRMQQSQPAYRQQPGYGQPAYYATNVQPPRLSLELSSESPYVQENILLRLRLISRQNLQTATPQLPQTGSVVFQKIDGPDVSSRKRDGKQEIITSFVYQVTPLRPGRIEIPPIRVSGEQTIGNNYTRSTREFDVTSKQDLVLSVKPAVSGDGPWLPLEQLNLKSQLPQKLEAVAGKPIKLSVEMTAVGASGNLLPSLENQLEEGAEAFRLYRDNTRTHTRLDRSGNKIIGRRIDTYTLVPQYGGDLTLPDLRISWWSTKHETAQHTSIPLKPIKVSGKSLPGDGLFGMTETSTLFPTGSPAAFWIPISVVFGVIFGYWLAVWITNRRRKEMPIAAFAPLSNAMKRPFRQMAPAFAPLSEKFRSARMILNPLNRWQKLRRDIIHMLPLSLRFWFCVRLVEEEEDPEVWGYTLRFLANKHLNLPPRAPFAEIGNHILAFIPRADPLRVRKLLHDLDQSLYGHQELDFERWKQQFKHEIRPRLSLFPGRSRRKQVVRGRSLPDLNPLSTA